MTFYLLLSISSEVQFNNGVQLSVEDLTAQIPVFTVICQDRISFTSATEKFFKSPKLNCSGLKAVIFTSADKHGTLVSLK